jgi:transcriptional regulator with XRE-family HTH domain
MSSSSLFGRKIQVLRSQTGMTQAALARDLGLSRFYINNIESGRKQASLDVALRVAEALGVSLDYLLNDQVPVKNVIREIRSPQRPSLALLPSKLRHQRERHGLTQAALANVLGLKTHSAVSMLESGERLPATDTLARIAAVYGVSIDYLIYDDLPIDAPDLPERSD